MADRVLRDHSEPCKHYDPVIAGPDPSKDQISGQTYLLGHVVIGSPGGFWCPGGREVTMTQDVPLCHCGAWLSHLCDCTAATVHLISKGWRIDREGNRV